MKIFCEEDEDDVDDSDGYYWGVWTNRWILVGTHFVTEEGISPNVAIRSLAL